ncbi:MAG: hypothetical protein EXS13_00460 [Planctomycetes bacterium]|nr:hypothetical protein [Planctomycetota bacterium]
MAKRGSAADIDEVTDLEPAPAPAQAKEMDLAGGLAFVTFAALAVGVVLGQLALKKYFQLGMFQ